MPVNQFPSICLTDGPTVPHTSQVRLGGATGVDKFRIRSVPNSNFTNMEENFDIHEDMNDLNPAVCGCRVVYGVCIIRKL
jgi:hypothetical protein